MVKATAGETYTAGCSKFPLPFTILVVNPVFPRITILDELGVRTVRLSWLDSCIRSGCVTCTNHANVHYDIGTCKAHRPVVSCVNGGPHTASHQTAQNGQKAEIVTMATSKFVKMQNASGRYAIFQIPGHKGRIYIDTALFPGAVTPSEMDLSGTVDAGAETVAAGDPEKAAAAAAKAQEKADKAAAKAAAQAEKAAARVAKTQAAAEAAIARANKAAAAAQVQATGAVVAPEAQPEL